MYTKPQDIVVNGTGVPRTILQNKVALAQKCASVIFLVLVHLDEKVKMERKKVLKEYDRIVSVTKNNQYFWEGKKK